MENLKKVLSFLSLMNDTGDSISLTNIALVVLVAKMAVSPNLDWPAVVTIMTVFANYAHKRDSRKTDSELSTELAGAVKEQAASIEEFRKKIIPAIDLIKGKVDNA